MKSKGVKEENAISVTTGVPLDKKDIAILRLLQQDGRMTVKEIAAQVHLSVTPVHERIRRMEESGAIQQYAALLNPALLGKGLMVICYVSLRQHDKNAGLRFIQSIRELDEVVECYSISGEFDFMLKVLSSDMADFYDFHVNKLSQVENMGHVQSIFVMGVIKQTHKII
ncbi:MAG: Lrp/AsnC family transcriptional regulator [Niabella sp.]